MKLNTIMKHEIYYLGKYKLGKLPLLFGKLPLGKLNIWEDATWENTHGKLPLEKRPLGNLAYLKYIDTIWLAGSNDLSDVGAAVNSSISERAKGRKCKRAKTKKPVQPSHTVD